ncbi:MAG TPA: tryptophan synthase subunit alpha [Longimicrobium sp.]|nr:tryptophan synthase subunit alpha [Longimicrobium sp.]
MTTSSDRAALARAFQQARDRGRAALVPYITAGHPSAGDTAAILRMLADEGADVIELGVPFSDPLADGPTIQRSSFRAIEQGVDLEWTLRALAGFRRERDTPVVLFTYLNPILHHGVDRFLEDAAAAGANAVLLTDLPVGEAAELEDRFEAAGMDLIRLVSPTTTPERVKTIARAARGFLYYVSRTGVTGAVQSLSEGLAAEVAEVRAVTSVPVAVGFGISTGAQAAEVATIADGVVVGSALVDRLERGGVEGARALMRELRGAVDGVARG